MRVIAGSARSLRLITPKGENTRPTLDRIKETLFNILRDEVPGSVFLDLFAGSGGIGIEALSRGARHAYFFERDREALACIRKNLEHTGLSDRATVLPGDLFSSLNAVRDQKADLIYIDPPYEGGYEGRLFELFRNAPFVSENTLIILEADLGKDFDFEGFSLEREKRYKTNKHLFYRLTAGKGRLSNEKSDLSGIL
ncbi:MAG: 16S rRNA (guanine(966)-N(2))-methyltransferase RsmD [Lachnospiraceae bacterium]|nr:16S rRNA (guanine(966)-N(2))-methyltransferase RsmD [Lachnospiraceae bacterium]